MGAEKLDKKRSGALVGGIFLILAVPVCGIQVPVQAFFFLAWIYVILFLEANSYSWNELQEAMVHSCTRAVSPIFFLLCAGAMTGIWNLSGTIPGLTYTGILWIRPEWYPVTAYAGCFLFSFLTGSVFSSCGTMGILFLNIGTSMGYEEKIAVAVIIAGAFCGYGISPMSDFVNLLSSSVEIELAKTLKAERNSIIPTICVCLAGCFYAGWKNAELAGISIQESSKMIQIFGEMCLGMPVYIPAAVVLIFMLMRKNAIHALMAGCVSGMAVAFFYQKYRWQTILNVLWNGPDQGSYFHSGGISSMAGTVLLFLLAFSLFGMLEKSGAIRCMMQPLFKWADTEKKGNIAAILFAFVVNVFSASAMCSLVISVSCLMPVYDEKGCKREKMIHSLFLGALYMSLLVPWHSNVVTPMGLLGVAQGGACIFWIVPVLEVVCYLLTFVFSHK